MNCPRGLCLKEREMGDTCSQPPRNRDFFIMSLK